MGLKVLPLSITFQSRLYATGGSFDLSFQMYPANLVLFLFFQCLSFELCWYHLVLNHWVDPQYFSSTPLSCLVTVHWYTTFSPSTWHFPCRGQFPMQNLNKMNYGPKLTKTKRKQPFLPCFEKLILIVSLLCSCHDIKTLIVCGWTIMLIIFHSNNLSTLSASTYHCMKFYTYPHREEICR